MIRNMLFELIFLKLESFWILLIVFFGLILFLIIMLVIIVMLMNKSVFGHRIENPKHLKYFSVNDFSGLKANEFSFDNNNHEKLKGYIYMYDRDNYLGIIVVSHGIGGGHLAYITEIAHFASLGFKVISYDNTGTASSNGKKINGLPQAVMDLECCLSYIQNKEDLKKEKIILYGHSMGGYAVCNAVMLNNHIDGVVALAPADNYISLVRKNLIEKTGKRMSFLCWFFRINEKLKFKKYASLSTYNSLQTTKVNTLVVQGTMDNMVQLQQITKIANNNNNPYVKYLLVPDKRHRPNISDEAVIYDLQVEFMFEKLKSEFKVVPDDKLFEFRDSIDYDLLVEFDNVVMEHIDSFIMSCLK